MTDARLQELRRLVRQGETPPDLVEALRSTVARLARLRLLPPTFAPYGQWDDEAAEEVFASWYTDRLLGRGHLQSLLDRSNTVGAFRRLAERSLRQHLLNAKDRTQVQNLYRRLIAILDERPPFFLALDAARPQERWYALDANPPLWSGDDRRLVAHAWALGDFTVVRYRADAAKLSPVLDTAELESFVSGLMQRAAAALTPTLIMRALSARFDLGEPRLEPIETTAAEPTTLIDRDVVLRDTARSVLAELSPRQVEVLGATADGDPVAEIARRLSCSMGTVVNEQRRVGDVVRRFSADDDERDGLLNIVADLVYFRHDA